MCRKPINADDIFETKFFRGFCGLFESSGVRRKLPRARPKFRHICVTSQIKFMGSAEGKENRNPGRTPNAREKPACFC